MTLNDSILLCDSKFTCNCTHECNISQCSTVIVCCALFLRSLLVFALAVQELHVHNNTPQQVGLKVMFNGSKGSYIADTVSSYS